MTLFSPSLCRPILVRSMRVMPSPETISTAALAISVTSLALSTYIALRDRGRLRTKSTFYAAHEDRPPSIRVEAVNVGRRPVILTLFGGYYERGHWSGTYIGDHKAGVRLGEKERFSENIDNLHHMLFDHDTGTPVSDLWFEDTLGRRYRVKNAKKHLAQFFKQDAG
jgi:hypothetical protein